MTSGSAELRLIRSMAVVVAIGAALFALLSFPSIEVQQDFAPAWWTVAAVLSVFALPVLTALAMPIASLTAARILLGVAGVGYLTAAFSSLFIVSPLPLAETEWVLNNTGCIRSCSAPCSSHWRSSPSTERAWWTRRAARSADMPRSSRRRTPGRGSVDASMRSSTTPSSRS